MKENHLITFVIFTYNEQARIERVIQNFKDYGKILIADNNSSDKTLEIARSYGCDIYLRKKDYVFVENQELVNELYKVIDTEWIYWGFADEMLEKKSLDQLTALIKEEKYDVITMDRKNYFYGKFCYDLYHARTYKLFKKHSIDFTDNPIHSMGKATVPDNRICNLSDNYFIHHFISNTAYSYLNVVNKYTDCEIKNSFSHDTSLIKFIFLISKTIFRDFWTSKGNRNGFASIALSQLMLSYFFVKNMKMYEKLENLNSEEIERFNNEKRNDILLDFSN